MYFNEGRLNNTNTFPYKQYSSTAIQTVAHKMTIKLNQNVSKSVYKTLNIKTIVKVGFTAALSVSALLNFVRWVNV